MLHGRGTSHEERDAGSWARPRESLDRRTEKIIFAPSWNRAANRHPVTLFYWLSRSVEVFVVSVRNCRHSKFRLSSFLRACLLHSSLSPTHAHSLKKLHKSHLKLNTLKCMCCVLKLNITRHVSVSYLTIFRGYLYSALYSYYTNTCMFDIYCSVHRNILWNNQQMSQCAVKFYFSPSPLYMFRAAHTPIIRSTILELTCFFYIPFMWQYFICLCVPALYLLVRWSGVYGPTTAQAGTMQAHINR
jgi:hypothetical protein